MKKSDLKTGMMVVTRDGDEYMVMLGVSYAGLTSDSCDVIVSKDGWIPLCNYSDDLNLKEDGMPEFNIVAVYLPLRAASLWRKDIAKDRSWKCVWKREEPPVEMTVAEIEKKLGIRNLKIIKEHDDE